jgi:hypothetical protein
VPAKGPETGLTFFPEGNTEEVLRNDDILKHRLANLRKYARITRRLCHLSIPV